MLEYTVVYSVYRVGEEVKRGATEKGKKSEDVSKKWIEK